MISFPTPGTFHILLLGGFTTQASGLTTIPQEPWSTSRRNTFSYRGFTRLSEWIFGDKPDPSCPFHSLSGLGLQSPKTPGWSSDLQALLCSRPSKILLGTTLPKDCHITRHLQGFHPLHLPLSTPHIIRSWPSSVDSLQNAQKAQAPAHQELECSWGGCIPRQQTRRAIRLEYLFQYPREVQ